MCGGSNREKEVGYTQQKKTLAVVGYSQKKELMTVREILFIIREIVGYMEISWRGYFFKGELLTILDENWLKKAKQFGYEEGNLSQC